MTMPRHAEQDEDSPDARAPRGRRLVIIVVIVVILIIVVALHLSGAIGPKAHGG